MDSLLIGLDVGTSSAKAVVFTADGRELSAGKARTPWSTTPDGTELAADDLVSCALEALGRALAAAPEGRVVALGVTGMGESGVLLDRRGEPVGPVIAWHDTRDRQDIADLQASGIGAVFSRTTGLPAGGQWSLTKHRWLVSRHPELGAAVRRLNVAEWIVRALGGAEATEQSLASRTGWLDVHARQWWPEALDWSGARASLMPELVTAGTPLGHVATGVGPPRLWGAALTVAGHDHQAAAIGAGACGPGDELDSCGTAEALVRTIPAGLDHTAVEHLAAAGITTGWHVLAGQWCLLGGTQGGLALQRLLARLGRSSGDVAALDAAAAAVPAGDDDTADEGSHARAWRDALQAVTAEAAVVHEAMSAVVGEHRSLVVTGGWSHSEGLLDAKRQTFGALRVAPVAEAGARGAALMGGVAAGLFETPTDIRSRELQIPGRGLR
jgi:sugar (pentulose or hexulose) kinase